MGGIEQWHLMSERISDNEYRICAPPEYFCGEERHLTEAGENVISVLLPSSFSPTPNMKFAEGYICWIHFLTSHLQRRCMEPRLYFRGNAHFQAIVYLTNSK